MNTTKPLFATELFGRRLKTLCDATAPYFEIARDLGINRQQFARYLNGSSMPRDALIRKMAEYFDIETSEFFNEVTGPNDALSSHPLATAIQEMVSGIDYERIPKRELPNGLYMQYKQSFTQPDKVVCMLARVHRDENGIVHWKRRYSVKTLPFLPGVRVSHVSHGLVVKTLGAIVVFDIDGIAGDLVFSSFRPSSVFSAASNVKTGVVMTHGRPSNLGPVAGIHILERIHDTKSALAMGRFQGFKAVSELPEQIRYYFEVDPALPRSLIAVR